MIKYLSYAAPLLLKTSKTDPVKNLTGLFIAYFLIALSIIFGLIASIIWLSKSFGAEIAFAATGVALLVIALILLMTIKIKKKRKVVRVNPAIANDPVAKYMPDALKTNPTVEKLLHQITKNPITATATAVTIGVLLSKELFEET